MVKNIKDVSIYQGQFLALMVWSLAVSRSLAILCMFIVGYSNKKFNCSDGIVNKNGQKNNELKITFWKAILHTNSLNDYTVCAQTIYDMLPETWFIPYLISWESLLVFKSKLLAR